MTVGFEGEKDGGADAARTYTLLNNPSSSKFDLYLPGRLVAALHYLITAEEILVVYCEAIDASDAEAHCSELVRRCLENFRNRRLPITVACPIAGRFMKDLTETTRDTSEIRYL